MPPQQSDEAIQIQATVARPSDISWIEHQLKEKQNTLQRLEETAKYLSGLACVSLSIMVGPNDKLLSKLSDSATLKIGIISWLVSILFTLAVVFPFRYAYAENSADSIRKMTGRIARVKFALLILGVLFFIIGISLLSYTYILSQAPPPAK